jgi:hypothetical protein
MSETEIENEAEETYQKLTRDLTDDEDADRKPELEELALSNVDHPLISCEGRVTFEEQKIWIPYKIEKLPVAQSIFLAPVLSDEVPNHDLGENIVPFTEKYATRAAGSFGEVSEYEIHKSHIVDVKRPVRSLHVI